MYCLFLVPTPPKTWDRSKGRSPLFDEDGDPYDERITIDQYGAGKIFLSRDYESMYPDASLYPAAWTGSGGISRLYQSESEQVMPVSWFYYGAIALHRRRRTL